jgi:hypothetical protein
LVVVSVAVVPLAPLSSALYRLAAMLDAIAMPRAPPLVGRQT